MNSKSTSPLYTRWPLVLAGLTAVAGVCLSISLQSRIAQTESAEARLTAETLRLNTEQELSTFGEVLESVRALHALSDEVNQAAMDEFIEKGLVHQHAILGAFGLAQRIGPQLRFVMEQEAASGSGTGYRVVKQGPNGSWVPAGSQPTHYPLTWQTEKNALNIPIGFDFSSVPAALLTAKRIEQTRRTALVPAPIPYRESSSPSYWVFAPVIPKQLGTFPRQPPSAVIGFALEPLHPEQILKRVTARSALSPELRHESQPASCSLVPR